VSCGNSSPFSSSASSSSCCEDQSPLVSLALGWDGDDSKQQAFKLTTLVGEGRIGGMRG
jgi:hypothetical protein